MRLLALPQLSTPPGVAPALAGFMNVAGSAVPVIDAARLLGLAYHADIDPLYRHILVIAAEGRELGLLVDRVRDVRALNLDGLTSAERDAVLNDCLLGDLMEAGRAIHVLDAGRLLLAFERARIADLRDAEQERLSQWGGP